MAHADIHTENIRLRTILQITAFELATLEYNLMHNAFIPNSLDEQKIRDATYRFYKASTSHPAHSYAHKSHFNVFDPYPYGEKPQHDTSVPLSAQLAAAVADRNERVSIKYDAVMDLIRMLAARKAHQSNAATAEVKVGQNTVTVTKEQLEEGKSRSRPCKKNWRNFELSARLSSLRRTEIPAPTLARLTSLAGGGSEAAILPRLERGGE